MGRKRSKGTAKEEGKEIEFDAFCEDFSSRAFIKYHKVRLLVKITTPLFGTSKKRTTESRVFDLEVLMAKFQKRFESIDKSLTETQDTVRRLHRVEEEKAQDIENKIEKKIDDVKTTVDRVLNEITVTMHNADADLRSGLENERGHIDNLYGKFDKLEARVNDLAAKRGEFSKPSPDSATTSLPTTNDPCEGKDYSPKVKKLIKDAVDTLGSSDDQR